MKFACQLAFACLSIAFVSGCGAPPGKPRGQEVIPPDQVTDFATLYSSNCAGCHGADGKGGAAISLADPLYLAIADNDALRNATANGVSGTQMPAFAQSAGGTLTSAQIDRIVDSIRTHWSQPNVLGTSEAPSYHAKGSGSAIQGGADYKMFCESCHGADGRGTPKGSSITNPAFLSLVSDQYLRTLVIVGRPELGAPDWRANVPGHPMSDQEITDVVAWLASQRPAPAALSAPTNELHPQEPGHAQ